MSLLPEHVVEALEDLRHKRVVDWRTTPIGTVLKTEDGCEYTFYVVGRDGVWVEREASP